jgi:hypothetical protein
MGLILDIINEPNSKFIKFFQAAIGIFQMKNIMFSVFFLITLLSLFLLLIVNADAQDYIIHTDNDVYYYPDVGRYETIVLPNDEVIDSDNLIDLQINEDPFRTDSGLDFYRTEDDTLFMEGDDYDSEN